MYSYYEYDKNGNKTFEGYISLKDPLNVIVGAKDYYQYANITYDALNRIKSIADPKANITYEYDAVGQPPHGQEHLSRWRQRRPAGTDTNKEWAGIDIFRLTENGKIIEHRDVLQVIPIESKK